MISSEGAKKYILENGPPKVLFLTSTDMFKGEEADFDQLYINNGRLCKGEFSATDLFSRCGVGNVIKNLFVVIDQLGNWSIFKEGLVNENAFFFLSARAIYRSEKANRDREHPGMDLGSYIKMYKGNLALIRPDNTIGPVREEGKDKRGNLPDDQTYLHVKSIIVMGESRNTVIWGSPNWTFYGLHKNAEFIIADSCPNATFAELLGLAKYIQYLLKKVGREGIINAGAGWLLDFEEKFIGSNSDCLKYREFTGTEDARQKVAGVLGRILSERKSKEKSRVWNKMKGFDYYFISEDTLALYTFPKEEGIESYGPYEGNRHHVGSDLAFFIRAMLGSAKSSITISAMSIFDREKDLILEKLNEIMAKPDIKLKFLVDPRWAILEPDKEEQEEVLGLSRLAEHFVRIVGPEEVSVYSNKFLHNPSDAEKRVEIYTAGKEGKDDWTFHAKMIVVDSYCALFTTANFKQAGYWGGLSVLNKYYFTRKKAWVGRAISYLNAYFFWTKNQLKK